MTSRVKAGKRDPLPQLEGGRRIQVRTGVGGLAHAAGALAQTQGRIDTVLVQLSDPLEILANARARRRQDLAHFGLQVCSVEVVNWRARHVF